ncbi:MAG: hypothetical protein V3T83_15470, partial [Acidobacteriota bacterium]
TKESTETGPLGNVPVKLVRLPQTIDLGAQIRNRSVVFADGKLKHLEQIPTESKFGLVWRGSEWGHNDPFREILKQARFVFMANVDDSLVDDQRIFPWTVGVALYRGFPLPHQIGLVKPTTDRPYFANWIGSLNSNPSRVTLTKVIRDNPQLRPEIVVRVREEWKQADSKEEAEAYLEWLMNSVYTLCPSGCNVDTYRILEAVSFGSVPIIHEEDHPQNQCGRNPLRLYHDCIPKPPFVFLESWDDLPSVFQSLRDEETIHKRQDELMAWHRVFCRTLTSRVVEQAESRLLDRLK